MLIGRARETRALTDALDALEAGRGGFILLSGEAGIGKSTLLRWTLEEAARRGLSSARTAGWEAVDVPPLWIWNQVFDQLGTDEAPFEGPGPDGQVALFGRIAASLGAAVTSPHLVTLDDLHAADEDSLMALAYVVSASTAPILFVGAFDPVAIGRIPHRERALTDLARRAVPMSLGGLSQEEVEEMLKRLFPEPPADGTVEAIHRATQGNPLFVEEVARMFAAEGDLHRPDHSVGFRAPAGVRGVVRSRSAALDPLTREALMVASVIGKSFEVSLLQRILDLDLDGVLERLQEAAETGFVAESSSLGVYEFIHILVREAFYDDLSTAQRMRLHHKVATALEELEGDHSQDRLQMLAHHWFKAAQAGDFAKALELSTRAAAAAAAQGAYEESERLYKRALQVAGSAGADAEALDRLREELAAVEAARGSSPSESVGSDDPYVFRREGEFWTVRYRRGRTGRLKDTKGMRYLAQMLRTPGQEIHVLDLVASVDAPPVASTTGAAEIETAESEQPLLDAAAKKAYKQRLEDLRDDLEEARANNDPERAARYQEEIDALVDQLSAAAGLGGRDRSTVTAAERARINVTKVVKEALRRIEASDPELGTHLKSTVRTGVYLSYMPDPRFPVPWVF